MLIDIDFRKSSRENANAYFEKAKHARKKKEAARKALEAAESEMKEAVMEERKKEKPLALKKRVKRKWYENYRWFFTSDGFLAIGGRDASQNEMIFKKHIRKDDIVLHADVHGAPLTVIKSDEKEITQEAIREAAGFAVSYSSAWKRRFGSADVYWINPEQVSKKAPAGTSLAKGAFMIYGRKNYLRNISLKVDIGIVFERDGEGKAVAYPICGPAQSVNAHAKYFVTIAPGALPHSELIREVRKRLAAKALPEDRPLIEAIAAEEIERLLPAGNSDVIG